MASYVEGSFKKNHKMIDRRTESERIRKKYPDRIPIIVEHSKNSDNIPTIDKQKYLVPGDLTMGQFSYVIRKRIKLSPEKALFLMVNNKLVNTSEIMNNIYEKEKDVDGFIYIILCGENTFGSYH